MKPFRCYHVSVLVKTEGFDAASDVRIAVLAPGGVSLNYYEPRVARTQNWRRVDITFDSLEFTKLSLYLGVWRGSGGKIWWDDLRIEPSGLVNVVRRGQLLAENVKRCFQLIREQDPGKPIFAWSDMFDPFPQRQRDGPLLPGQGRRTLVWGLGRARLERNPHQLEFTAGLTRGLTQAFCRPWPQANSGRVLRRSRRSDSWVA